MGVKFKVLCLNHKAKAKTKVAFNKLYCCHGAMKMATTYLIMFGHLWATNSVTSLDTLEW